MCTAIGNNDPVPLQGRIWPAAALKIHNPARSGLLYAKSQKKPHINIFLFFVAPCAMG